MSRAWIWAIVAFADHPVLLGTALLAYSFGLRHAVDADHIAAIDNVTRKLMQDGQHPVTAGLYFSLGHSTVVVLASIVVALGATALSGLETFGEIGGVIGTTVSALFLFAIAIANIFILVAVYKTFQRVKRGEPFVEDDLNILLANRGLLGRLFRPLFRFIRASWQMYPLGFLFGLGFDTATEIGVLGISAAQAAQGLVVLVAADLPGAVHRRHEPRRHDRLRADGARLWLGLREADPQALLQPHHHVGVGRRGASDRQRRGARADRREARALRRRLGLDRDAERAVRRARLLIIGLFIVSWIVSVAIYRYKGYDQLEIAAASPRRVAGPTFRPTRLRDHPANKESIPMIFRNLTLFAAGSLLAPRYCVPVADEHLRRRPSPG